MPTKEIMDQITVPQLDRIFRDTSLPYELIPSLFPTKELASQVIEGKHERTIKRLQEILTGLSELQIFCARNKGSFKDVADYTDQYMKKLIRQR